MFFSLFSIVFFQFSTYDSLMCFLERQYFIVLFKNNNPELWDAVTMSQLREFPESFPSITALVGLCIYYFFVRNAFGLLSLNVRRIYFDGLFETGIRMEIKVGSIPSVWSCVRQELYWVYALALF